MTNSTLRNAVKRACEPELRAAEKFATARSSIRYAPDATSETRRALENQRLRDGLCIHGKYPRLLAEQLRIALGVRVPTCRRCA